mgnify:CR=1 FL=1
MHERAFSVEVLGDEHRICKTAQMRESGVSCARIGNSSLSPLLRVETQKSLFGVSTCVLASAGRSEHVERNRRYWPVRESYTGGMEKRDDTAAYTSLIQEARAAIDWALVEAGHARHSGGHRHWNGREPVRLRRRGKTRRGMFLLARFERLLSIGRPDLIGKIDV